MDNGEYLIYFTVKVESSGSINVVKYANFIFYNDTMHDTIKLFINNSTLVNEERIIILKKFQA